MPLDKNMSHEDMVAELITSYKKTGKIGATKPRDMEHALQIANAVAYNIEESIDIKKIEKEVEEMKLHEVLNTLENYLNKAEKELGIVNEAKEEPYLVIFYTGDEGWAYNGRFKTLEEAKNFVLEHVKEYPSTVSFEIRKTEDGKTKSLGGGKPDVNKDDMNTLVSEALTKITLDNGQTIETETDETDDEIKKDFEIGKEIEVGQGGATRKAKIKSVEVTRNVGESFRDTANTYHIDYEEFNKNHKWKEYDEIPEEWKEFMEDSDYTFNNVSEMFKKAGYFVDVASILESGYIVFLVEKEGSYTQGKRPTTDAMEISREYLVTHNAGEAFRKILGEIQDRYPQVLEESFKVHPRRFKINEEDSGDMGADQVLPFGSKNKVKTLKNKKMKRTIKSEGLAHPKKFKNQK